jgi:predicted transcriptional regulator
MRTVTLELPEDLADRLEAMPADERNHFAVAVLRDGLAEREESDTEVIAALQESIADLDAGKGQSLDDYQAERSAFWAKHGL